MNGIFDAQYEKEAISFIRDVVGSDMVSVGFSGGKDSVCVAKLMELSGVKYHLFYSFTGIDPPELVRFIRRNFPSCVFLRPKYTFWNRLVKGCPPNLRLRWCCTLLKKDPPSKLPFNKRIFGIRTEESFGRRKRGRISQFKGAFHYYPIFHWKEWQVWEFIEKYNLPYSSLYDLGFSRLGCIVCPFHSGKHGGLHNLYRERWPKHFVLWEKCIRQLWSRRVDQGKKMFYDDVDEFIEAWYVNSCAPWYSKGKKRRSGFFS